MVWTCCGEIIKGRFTQGAQGEEVEETACVCVCVYLTFLMVTGYIVQAIREGSVCPKVLWQADGDVPGK